MNDSAAWQTNKLPPSQWAKQSNSGGVTKVHLSTSSILYVLCSKLQFERNTGEIERRMQRICFPSRTNISKTRLWITLSAGSMVQSVRPKALKRLRWSRCFNLKFSLRSSWLLYLDILLFYWGFLSPIPTSSLTESDRYIVQYSYFFTNKPANTFFLISRDVLQLKNNLVDGRLHCFWFTPNISWYFSANIYIDINISVKS